MTRALILLLCLLVPISAWRKAIRSKFVGPISRPKRMKRFNKIADWRLDDVDGVKVATGALRGGKTIRLVHVFGKDITPAYGAHEIFNDNEYHFSAQGKAVVIDIGMNYGFASLYFALRDDVEAVYAFEPAGPVYEKARFGFSLNECSDKITAYNCGLGDSDKTITLNFNPTGTGVTSTIPDYPSAGKIKLPAQIKDAAAEIRNIIARHPGKRVVVKCDCEGGEKEIFARLDAENVLPSIDLIMMEYHHNYDEFIESLLDKHGFVYFKSTQHRSVGIIRAVNGNHRQSNAAVSGKG